MSHETPTVVLVHGAFADGSSWNAVIERLQARGVKVTAPANPLRGISVDSTYTASVFEQIPGPVLAVGHSYGGAVITNAAAGTSNVVGLVYVAAFAPDVPVDPTARVRTGVHGTVGCPGVEDVTFLGCRRHRRPGRRCRRDRLHGRARRRR